MDAVARLRPVLKDKLVRVGADVFEGADAAARHFIDAVVQSHPSVGKTISTGIRKEDKNGR